MAVPPLFDPPIDTFRNLYQKWAHGQYGIIVTGQVQIDIRFLSIAGDVVCHDKSLAEPHISKWKEWAQIAKSGGTPCIVQLAHPGRMSPAGAGVRPPDMQTLCPSSVPVQLGNTWLDKLVRAVSRAETCHIDTWQALDKVLGTPKAMTLQEIDEVVEMWKRGARVAKEAGFDGVQLHGKLHFRQSSPKED